MEKISIIIFLILLTSTFIIRQYKLCNDNRWVSNDNLITKNMRTKKNFKPQIIFTERIQNKEKKSKNVPKSNYVIMFSFLRIVHYTLTLYFRIGKCTIQAFLADQNIWSFSNRSYRIFEHDVYQKSLNTSLKVLSST